ncbi:PPK2 family polyphosphate:nucleotide phosphotransferase [Winogradskyella epiphytica]|uniref:PPK2 family polyphosphate:nucleotide phosphotransferase n=1 Tax=Winogradskyella epiphytica TaxID=262005 RepID=A0A2V4WVL8_9FLAO|nr:PPK2 family polyphosphate kinase [Winogradskyella epiphytica]PYE80990.1 PPK2 family polyphosphate:nucleotide phosphotransferase [Winogradskyella epiphytica]GGW66033.1 polyphosphate kinase [Winogradskyella epiphytica]
MKEVDIKDFKITSDIKIEDLPTSYDLESKKKKIKRELRTVSENLAEIQNRMYAHGKYAVLMCIQGMDTAGKDSLIREVFKEFNVRGIVAHSFKTPTALELRHDYLWRHDVALPERGKFGIFNRTHYENVLVTRVHPEYLLNENMPDINSVDDVNDAFWDRRFDEINNFEKRIANNGTIVFKFFLNLSKDEQKNRLLRRLNKPTKNWKFSPDDLDERKLWDQYQHCYEDAIDRTSKPHAPWYNIPADDKPTARYIVAKILYDTLKEYEDITEPELPAEQKAKVDHYKEQLEKE